MPSAYFSRNSKHPRSDAPYAMNPSDVWPSHAAFTRGRSTNWERYQGKAVASKTLSLGGGSGMPELKPCGTESPQARRQGGELWTSCWAAATDGVPPQPRTTAAARARNDGTRRFIGIPSVSECKARGARTE